MEKREFIDKLFARAKEEGFEAWEAFYESGENFDSDVFGGEIVNYNSARTLGLGFRALIGGRMGYASTQILDEDAVEMLIRGAKDGAAVIENEDKQFIFGGCAEYAKVDNYSEALDNVGADEKIKLALEMEKLALAADPRVKRVNGCGTVTMSGERAIYNSRGLDVSHKYNFAAGYIDAVAEDGGKVNTGMEVKAGQNFSDIIAGELASGAVACALEGLDAQQVESGKYKIAFFNKAMRSMLATFSGVFSADAAQKGLSMLKGREGEAIASEAVTIVDDPHYPGLTSSAPFDGEGVPTYKKNIVEKGVLTTLLHNLKTAEKQGVTTTGNASRGSYASTVGVAPANLFIQPSETSFEALIADIGTGVLIKEVSGLHAGANVLSGDFSLLAKGNRIENGKLGAPVNQITVAGNFYELLRGVKAVADDLDFGMGSFGSPTVYAGELSVAGK